MTHHVVRERGQERFPRQGLTWRSDPKDPGGGQAVFSLLEVIGGGGGKSFLVSAPRHHLQVRERTPEGNMGPRGVEEENNKDNCHAPGPIVSFTCPPVVMEVGVT